MFDGIVDNNDSGSVVDVNQCWWLWVSEFCKSEMEDLGFLCIERGHPIWLQWVDAATSLSIVHVMWMAPSSLIGLPLIERLPRKK